MRTLQCTRTFKLSTDCQKNRIASQNDPMPKQISVRLRDENKSPTSLRRGERSSLPILKPCLEPSRSVRKIKKNGRVSNEAGGHAGFASGRSKRQEELSGRRAAPDHLQRESLSLTSLRVTYFFFCCTAFHIPSSHREDSRETAVHARQRISRGAVPFVCRCLTFATHTPGLMFENIYEHFGTTRILLYGMSVQHIY